MGFEKVFLYTAGFLYFYMYYSCLATYNFEGTPEQDELVEVTSGTVKGGLYVDGGKAARLLMCRIQYSRRFVTWAKDICGIWGNEEKPVLWTLM